MKTKYVSKRSFRTRNAQQLESNKRHTRDMVDGEVELMRIMAEERLNHEINKFLGSVKVKRFLFWNYLAPK